MQYAVALSIVLLLLVCTVPFLQPIFNTHFMTLAEWRVVLGLALIPAVAEEITKFFLRLQDRRMKTRQLKYSGDATASPFFSLTIMVTMVSSLCRLERGMP